MKKIYLFGIIASAGLAMTSCSSDETTENVAAQGNVIEFGTYLGRDAQTRGTVMDDGTLENMGVYASYTNGNNFSASTNTPNFMHNQLVTKENGTWNYSPLKYWPTTVGDKVSFFAYAPYTEKSGPVDNTGASGDVLNSGSGNTIISTNSTNSDTGAPTLIVTLPSDLTKMVDFVAGVKMNQTHTQTGNANTAVNFTLKHELTRVGMKAKVSQDVYSSDAQDAQHKTKVVITGIKLDGINNGQFYESGVYTFPTNENSRGTWEGTAAAKGNDFNLNTLLKKESYNITTSSTKEGIILKEKDNAVSLFNDNEYLFLIPASNNTGEGLGEGKATATISYDIVTEDNALANGYSVSSATKTVNIPSGTLKQGKAYTLTFTINVDEVKLSANVADWEDTPAETTVDYGSTDKE